MIIDWSEGGFYEVSGAFRFPYSASVVYGWAEVRHDMLSLHAKINTIVTKLPDDFLSGSTDKTSLESRHGSGSWEGGGGVTPAEIADAVWEEPHGEHVDTSTFGGLIHLILKAASKVFIPIRKR